MHKDIHAALAKDILASRGYGMPGLCRSAATKLPTSKDHYGDAKVVIVAFKGLHYGCRSRDGSVCMALPAHLTALVLHEH